MIWFITGASKGFGREFAIAALERGDRVAATARDTKSLADLSGRFGERVLPLRLDITDRAADFEAVGRVLRRVRWARRRGQQRRLRPLRRFRGALRGRPARSAGDQSVRGGVDHPGGAALPARPAVRGTSCRFPASVASGRSPTNPPITRRSGRWKPSVNRWRPRSGPLGYQGDHRGAGPVQHRLGRLVGAVVRPR